MEHKIDDAINKLHPRPARQYERLPETFKHDIARQFERHARACERCNVSIDPCFLPEAITEGCRAARSADAVDFLDAIGVEIS